jgi:hypothetical protein
LTSQENILGKKYILAIAYRTLILR